MTHGFARLPATRLALAALALLLPLLLLSCGDDADGDEAFDTPVPTVTPSPTITPQPTTAAPPGDTPVQPTPERTPRPSGGELIDAVIAAVEGQDAARLQGLIHYWLAACTEPGIAAIPCLPGQEPGSVVNAFGWGCGEASFQIEGDEGIATAVQQFLEVEHELYGVAVAPPFPGEERIPGHYVVIFRNLSGQFAGAGSAVSVDHEGVTFLHFPCSPASTPESFTHGSTEWVIPPN